MAISISNRKLFFTWALISGALLWAPLAHAAIIKPANNLGLVGYWPFNEGSGTVTHDYSGKGDTLALSNSPTWIAGKAGQALNFNSASIQFASHADIPALNFGTGDFSVSFWIKPSSPWGTATTQGVLGQKTDDSHNGWQVYQDSGHPGHLDMRLTQQNNFLTNATIPTGTWTYATFVRKGGVTYWYINGVQDAAGTDTSNISDTAPLYVGYAQTWSAYYNGALDDVRIYNRGLSSTEVSALYQGAVTKYDAPASSLSDGSTLLNGLVGWWPFDGSTIGSTIKDMSGNGNNGYVFGGVATSSMLVQGKLGQAMQFNGSSSYMTVLSGWDDSVTSKSTVAGWVKLSSLSSYGGIFSNFQGGSNSFVELRIEQTTGKPAFIFGNSSFNYISVTGTTGLTPGQWYYVVGVWSGGSSASSLAIYVNGVLQGVTTTTVGSFSGSYVPNSTETDVGRLGFSPSQIINGAIDDVRVYNRALTAAEVKQLYQEGAAKVNAPAATLSSGSTLSSGLMGYWSFDGADFTDKIYDRSGNSNNGYVTAGATSTMKAQGKLGQALSLSGSDATQAQIPNSSTLNPGTGSFTVAAWVKENAFVGSMVIAAKSNGGSPSSTYGWHLASFSGNQLALHFATGGSFTTISNSTALTTGKWYHVVAVVDRSNISNSAIYINGSPAGSSVSDGGNSGSVTNTLPLAIGNESDGGFGWNGQIDELRVYNRALSATEVQELYNLGK